MTDIKQTRADISKRNAGAECLVVWNDGTFEHCGTRDAELYALCEPLGVLLVIRLDTMESVPFFTLHYPNTGAYQRIITPPDPPERIDDGYRY